LAKELGRADRQKSLRDAGDVLAKGIESASQEIGGLLVPDGRSSTGSQIFPDGNVTDFLKQLDNPPAERTAGQQLEPSPDITELPEYKKLYAEALDRLMVEAEAKLERELEAEVDQYAKVEELQPGHEVEGEVEAIVERQDQAF